MYTFLTDYFLKVKGEPIKKFKKSRIYKGLEGLNLAIMAFRFLLHKWYVISSLFLPSLERVASTALVFGFARPMEKACLALLYCPPTYMREEGSHAEKPACSHIRHAQLSCAPNPAFLPQGAFQRNIFP